MLSPRRRPDLLALALLAALIAVVYRGVLTGDAVFCYEDFVAWFAPTRGLVDHALRAGSIAQWDPWVGLGQPLVFNSAAAPLYPLGVLQLLGAGMAGLHRLIVFHLFLGGALMYALARDRGARPAAAFPVAAAFAFCGPMVSYAQENPYHVFGLAWIPLSLLCFWRGIERRDLRWTLGAGAAMALMLYGGEPQVWYFNAFTLGAVALARPRGERARAFGHLGVVIGAALLLAAAQVTATAVDLGGSARGQGEPDDVRFSYSVHPLRLLTLALPYATGVFLPDNSLWGNGFTGYYRYWIHTLYVGLVPLLFAPAAFKIERRAATALLAVSGFFALMALGKFGGVYGLLEHVLPGLKMFRYPEKWAGAMAVPLLTVGALGLEAALRSPRMRSPLVAAGVVGAVGLAAFAGAQALRPYMAGVALFPAPELLDAGVERLRADGLQALGVCVAMAGALYLARKRAVLGAVLLAGVGAAEVVAAGVTPLVLAEPSLLEDAGPIARAMRDWDPHARYRREPNPAVVPTPRDAEAYKAMQRRARSTGALHMLIGEERHILLHGPPILKQEGDVLDEALWGDQALDGGALFGTRFYVIADKPPPPWIVEALKSGRFRAIGKYPELSALLVLDTQAFGRAFRVAATEVQENSTDPAVVRARLAAHYDFQHSALVDEDGLVQGRPAPVAPPSLHGDETTVPVNFVTDDPTRVDLITSGTQPGLLVLTDSLAPGWHAYVNDVEVPIHRADFVARGVEVPAGTARVRFEYEHPHLHAGIAVSLAAALACLAFVALRRRA